MWWSPMTTDDDLSDRALLQAWRQGDAEAANRLIGRHGPRLYNFFCGKVSEGADALCQQTLSAWLAAPVASDAGSPRSVAGQLFAFARTTLLEHFGQKQGRTERVDPLSQSIAELDQGVSEVIAVRPEQRQLQQALRKLPVDTQIALELHYWEGLSVEEIAAVVKAPAAQVSAGLEASRAELRAWLDDERAQDDLTVEALASDDDRSSR